MLKRRHRALVGLSFESGHLIIRLTTPLRFLYLGRHVHRIPLAEITEVSQARGVVSIAPVLPGNATVFLPRHLYIGIVIPARRPLQRSFVAAYYEAPSLAILVRSGPIRQYLLEVCDVPLAHAQLQEGLRAGN